MLFTAPSGYLAGKIVRCLGSGCLAAYQWSIPASMITYRKGQALSALFDAQGAEPATLVQLWPVRANVGGGCGARVRDAGRWVPAKRRWGEGDRAGVRGLRWGGTESIATRRYGQRRLGPCCLAWAPKACSDCQGVLSPSRGRCSYPQAPLKPLLL